MTNHVDLKFNLPTDADLERMLDLAPKMERFKVMDQVVSAGTAVVVKRARELAPRSTEADRKKRSRSQREGRTKSGDLIDWNYPLWKTIKRVIRKYNSRYGIGIVGPEWPKGNKAYFNTSPNGRREVLWGKVTGRVKQQVRNWIVQAADETKPAQLVAMKAKATELLDKVMRG